MLNYMEEMMLEHKIKIKKNKSEIIKQLKAKIAEDTDIRL